MDVEYDLKNRARWAINYVCARDRLSNETLGSALDVNKGTINNYRQMTTAPNISFAVRFCEQFGFYYQWFIFGIGEPYPGAREEHPEVCGPVDNPALAGSRITERRRALGLSVNDLANKIGVSKETAQGWELGNLPEGGLLTGLAGALKCSAEWILTGAETQYLAVGESAPSYGTEPQIDPFALAVSWVKLVFDSKNPNYIRDLMNHLETVKRMVRGEPNVPDYQWENTELRNEIGALKARLAELEKEIKRVGEPEKKAEGA